MTRHKRIDVRIRRDGWVLYLFYPLTRRAKRWVQEHISDDACWIGSAFVSEQRCARDIAHGMLDDGLHLEEEL